jgi:hydrophobe/amphiphile efflux-1 (HAE1) family protein
MTSERDPGPIKPEDQQEIAGQEVEKNDLASLSVRRPVLILVLNLLIALAGFAAFLAVDVRELPDVDIPVVSVRGVLPGASPETMDAQVTNIIEGAVARVSGIKNIRSGSEENSFRTHIEFLPEVDLATAAADVREAVNQAQRNLPPDVEQLAVVKADADAQPIINIAVTSKAYSEEELTLVIEKDIVPALIAIPGVADVPLFGQRQRVLRIVLDPLRLTSFNLSVAEVAAVLELAPLDVPSGSFRSQDQELLVRTDASTVTEDQVRDIIIAGDVRVGDVAYVSFGPEDAESLVYLNRTPVIGLGIVRQAQSNTIEISDGVRKVVENLNRRFDNVELRITEDRAVFIRGSVSEVVTSLIYAILIVVASLWLFLGSLRVTLIPSVTIPISLIGTLAAVWVMGFSINILTLLAIVLAAGLVVDDAIVVLENIQRRRNLGLGVRAGAVLGTRQVIFAVIATTAVLVSVFVPIAMLPGTTGQMFREFGLVLAAAVAISSFVALSLVPAMTIHFMPQAEPRPPSRLRRFGIWSAEFYEHTLARCIAFPKVAFAISLVIALGAAFLYTKLDNELLPPEDRSVLYVDATGPDGVGLNYMQRQADHMEALLQPLVDSGEAEGLFTIVGRYDPNRVQIMVPLKPVEERKRGQQEIIKEVQQALSHLPGVRIRVNSPNSLAIRGNSGSVELALLGNDYQVLYEASKLFVAAIEDRLPQLRQPDTSYKPTQPQLSIAIDRRRASDLGIPLDNIAVTLRAIVAGLDVVDLNVGDETIPIILQSSSTTVTSPQDLVNLYVKNTAGQLIPLSSVVTLREEAVAAELNRHAQRRAIQVDASLAPGYTLGQAVMDLDALAKEVLPDGIGILFLGQAQTLNETSRDLAFTYGIALLVVFLVLCAQFEGFTSAIIVMLIVPFGVAAAIYALFLTGTSINLYSQIGLVMLIGLMAKNGILLVEFADQLREEGYEIHDAVLEASKVRLRPITMTLLSTALGGLPLILSTGPGAEAREAIGWVMFGGLGLAAIFTLFLTPVVYLAIGRFQKPRSVESALLQQELEAAKGK